MEGKSGNDNSEMKGGKGWRQKRERIVNRKKRWNRMEREREIDNNEKKGEESNVKVPRR